MKQKERLAIKMDDYVKTKSKLGRIVSTIFAWVWVVSWFAAIWFPYHLQLFFTGIMAIIMALVFGLDKKK